MNKRFDITAVLVAATPQSFDLYDATDNASYYDQDGNAPTAGAYLLGFQISADTAVKVEIGVSDVGGANFTPAFPVYLGAGATAAALLGTAGPTLGLSATRKLAVRLTSAAGATVSAGGGIDITTR